MQGIKNIGARLPITIFQDDDGYIHTGLLPPHLVTDYTHNPHAHCYIWIMYYYYYYQPLGFRLWYRYVYLLHKINKWISFSIAMTEINYNQPVSSFTNPFLEITSWPGHCKLVFIIALVYCLAVFLFFLQDFNNINIQLQPDFVIIQLSCGEE